MRNPALAVVLSFAITSNAPYAFGSCKQTPPTQSPAPVTAPATAPVTAPPAPLAPGQFLLQDGTPIKLRLSRNVSSADATVGESVDFEVLDEVTVNGITVIPKGGTAIGTVTEAVPKRRMGRAGKLEIVLDYVRLADSEKAPVRAVKDAKGGSHVGGMTVGIVATSLVFFPAAPLFLLMHGKDTTIPKGAEVTAYINGDAKLLQAKFVPATPEVPATVVSPSGAAYPLPQSSELGAIELQSNPDGADIYVDGQFVGDAPATLRLSPGQHTIKIGLVGYQDWSRDVTVQVGSNVHLTANLEKAQAAQ